MSFSCFRLNPRLSSVGISHAQLPTLHTHTHTLTTHSNPPHPTSFHPIPCTPQVSVLGSSFLPEISKMIVGGEAALPDFLGGGRVMGDEYAGMSMSVKEARAMERAAAEGKPSDDDPA